MADAVAILSRRGPLAAHQAVSFGPVGPMTRLAARGNAAAAARFGRSFGVELSTIPLRACEAGGRAALWLGPDEWLLLAPEDAGLARHVEAGLAGEPGAIVDVSHRQVGLDVAGEGAAAVLNAGCPLDLGREAFPIGMSTRTVLAKAEIVLWRRAEHRFHVEVWRSFAPYVMDLLRQASLDCMG